MENNRMGSKPGNNEDKILETDTGKIVRRHLENEHDEITDEDIRNVRIVVNDEEPITMNADAKTGFIEEREQDKDGAGDETADPKDKPVTPWDVLDQ